MIGSRCVVVACDVVSIGILLTLNDVFNSTPTPVLASNAVILEEFKEYNKENIESEIQTIKEVIKVDEAKQMLLNDYFQEQKRKGFTYIYFIKKEK